MIRPAVIVIFSALILIPLAGCFKSGHAPVSTYGAGEGAGSVGMHVVARGDSIAKIAKRYRLSERSIAAANDLYPPYKLQAGQRLKLPPPETYKARSGDTVASVARLFAVEGIKIAQVNGLGATQKLKPGQVLRLPSVTVAEILKTDIIPVFAQAKPLPISPRPEFAPHKVMPKSAPNPLSPPEPPPSTNPIKPSVPLFYETPKAFTPSGSGRFTMPVMGPLLSSFGPKPGGLHNDGINIKAPQGAPVRAADSGVVVYAGNELKGTGNLVLIRHEGDYLTAYAHMDDFLIRRGESVKRGQSIGTVGSTGAVSESQLHFEIRKGTQAVDPKPYL
jgi:murein DD-endopeptidase MepM/ murein hydrolase activator NlpD